MLQYLVILLDDTSTSYCHYGVNKKERKLISLDDLRRGIRFGMVENLMIQFVYPDYTLPQEYLDVIDTIDHSNIKPMAALDNDTDIVTIDGWGYDASKLKDAVVALRTSWKQLNKNHGKLKDLLAEAIKALTKQCSGSSGIPGTKACMTLMGFRGGYPRLPLAPITEAEVARIAEALKKSEELDAI